MSNLGNLVDLTIDDDDDDGLEEEMAAKARRKNKKRRLRITIDDDEVSLEEEKKEEITEARRVEKKKIKPKTLRTIDDSEEKMTGARREKQNKKPETRIEIPTTHFLPVGVDVTDDTVRVDSDSEEESNLAEAHVKALLERKRQPSQQRGKFNHIQAAALKRKRKREKEAAEKKRLYEEEVAKRKQEIRELRKQQREEEAVERRRQQRQRRKAELERRRKAEAEALRKNPPTQVNFIIIDSDPEEDLTMSRSSPEKGIKRPRFSTLDQGISRKRRRTKPKPPPTTAKASSPQEVKRRFNREPQPYQGTGSVRVETDPRRPRPKSVSAFDNSRYFNYHRTHEDAAAEQERLLREAAERVKQRQTFGQDHVEAHPAASLYGPSFTEIVENIQQVYPYHYTWKSPYSCLGLPPNAGVGAAKQQYRTLVRCYHPDKSRQDTSKKFHAVVSAFKRICQQNEGN